MKIQVKQFAKKKIEALVKKDMQEWPPVVQAGCISRSVPMYLRSICKKNENKFNPEMAWSLSCFNSKKHYAIFLCW